MRLEYRLDRLWLVIEPTVWVADFEDQMLRNKVKEFVRERLASRYNPSWNKLLDGWSHLLVGDSDTAELRAFGNASGVDAAFTISRTTAFSWRGGVR